VALTFVTAVLGALVVLPFIDRGDNRRLVESRSSSSWGDIIAELIVLAIWGLLTPGQRISNLDAVEVLGGQR